MLLIFFHSNIGEGDMESQIQDSLGIKIIVLNAKAHTERGRVERRIRTLRESLDKLGNLPIARGDTSNETSLGFEIITPNRLRSLEGS